MTGIALKPPVPIQFGDVLLYSGKGFWSWLIKVKTWSAITHCEMANSDQSSLASRDGQGVNTYQFRHDRLVAILRPVTPLRRLDVLKFHVRCCGQAYDWLGLLRFVTLGKQSQDKQFCSEYLVRLLRAGGCEPFTAQTDADLVPPGMLLASPALQLVWRAGE